MLHETIYLREAENRTDVWLKTYVRENLFRNKPRPAVIVCPGGAYGFCSEGEGEPIADRFLAMGYHAFVLHYTVRSLGKNGFADDNPNDTTWPHPFFDLAAAILTVKEHAAEWNVDPDQIVIIGFSAGGHLAGMYATQWNSPLLQKRFGKSAEAFKIKAAMLIYAVLEWEGILRVYVEEGNESIAKAIHMRLLGIENPTVEDCRAVSPAWLVTKDTVPCFIVHAQNDPTVPVEGALLMAEQLRKNDVPFALHVFEEGSHGFSLAHRASASLQLELHPDLAVWPDLADKWLEKRLHIELEANPPWPVRTR